MQFTLNKRFAIALGNIITKGKLQLNPSLLAGALHGPLIFHMLGPRCTVRSWMHFRMLGIKNSLRPGQRHWGIVQRFVPLGFDFVSEEGMADVGRILRSLSRTPSGDSQGRRATYSKWRQPRTESYLLQVETAKDGELLQVETAKDGELLTPSRDSQGQRATYSKWRQPRTESYSKWRQPRTESYFKWRQPRTDGELLTPRPRARHGKVK
jgi:hypothetical protein